MCSESSGTTLTLVLFFIVFVVGPKSAERSESSGKTSTLVLFFIAFVVGSRRARFAEEDLWTEEECRTSILWCSSSAAALNTLYAP